MGKYWTSLVRWVGVPLLIVVLLTGALLFLDLLGRWGTEAARVDAPTTGNSPHDYPGRVSTYSLVSVGALEPRKRTDEGSPKDAAPLAPAYNSKLFACLGQVRHADANLFVDVTALTVAIVAIENYNRNFFRQKAEIFLQDVMGAFGLDADYTIGIAQIKTSLARQQYFLRINANASEQQFKSFSRSDCGSSYLASLLVVRYLDECKTTGLSAADLDQTIKCVTQKYTGLRQNSRLFHIYSAAVLASYQTLFDGTSEFYSREFKAQLGIQRIRAGACIEFNPHRPQIRSEPKEEKEKDSENGPENEPGPPSGKENFQMDRATPLELARPDPGNQSNIVKIIPAAGTPAHARQEAASQLLLRQREDSLVQYACKKFGTRTVDLYPPIRKIPDAIRRYCDKPEAKIEPGTYVLLVVTGQSGIGGAASRACPSAPPARPPEQPAPKSQSPVRR
jgi:hypothetical protein